MFALQGYYDGKTIQPLEKIIAGKNQKLIITILDEFIQEAEEELDTNMILRYLLNDNEEMASEAEPEILRLGIETYAKYNLDFPDCILYAYNRVKGYEIKTFGKKLNKLLKDGK